MATWIVHLRIAENLLVNFPGVSEKRTNANKLIIALTWIFRSNNHRSPKRIKEKARDPRMGLKIKFILTSLALTAQRLMIGNKEKRNG
jgi:hypothetical protein